MEYLVNIFTSEGDSKVKRIEAKDVKDAEKKAGERYPSCEVGRICPVYKKSTRKKLENHPNYLQRQKRFTLTEFITT